MLFFDQCPIPWPVWLVELTWWRMVLWFYVLRTAFGGECQFLGRGPTPPFHLSVELLYTGRTDFWDFMTSLITSWWSPHWSFLLRALAFLTVQQIIITTFTVETLNSPSVHQHLEIPKTVFMLRCVDKTWHKHQFPSYFYVIFWCFHFELSHTNSSGWSWGYLCHV